MSKVMRRIAVLLAVCVLMLSMACTAEEELANLDLTELADLNRQVCVPEDAKLVSETDFAAYLADTDEINYYLTVVYDTADGVRESWTATWIKAGDTYALISKIPSETYLDDSLCEGAATAAREYLPEGVMLTGELVWVDRTGDAAKINDIMFYADADGADNNIKTVWEEKDGALTNVSTGEYVVDEESADAVMFDYVSINVLTEANALPEGALVVSHENSFTFAEGAAPILNDTMNYTTADGAAETVDTRWVVTQDDGIVMAE